jgi:hypothetical protein
MNSAIIAIVEHESNSKPLYMCASDPIPQTCIYYWERACRMYANNKDIPVDKIIKHMLDGFEDIHFVNWIELDCDHLESLTLKEFMKVFVKCTCPCIGRMTSSPA